MVNSKMPPGSRFDRYPQSIHHRHVSVSSLMGDFEDHFDDNDNGGTLALALLGTGATTRMGMNG